MAVSWGVGTGPGVLPRFVHLTNCGQLPLLSLIAPLLLVYFFLFLFFNEAPVVFAWLKIISLSRKEGIKTVQQGGCDLSPESVKVHSAAANMFRRGKTSVCEARASGFVLVFYFGLNWTTVSSTSRPRPIFNFIFLSLRRPIRRLKQLNIYSLHVYKKKSLKIARRCRTAVCRDFTRRWPCFGERARGRDENKEGAREREKQGKLPNFGANGAKFKAFGQRWCSRASEAVVKWRADSRGGFNYLFTCYFVWTRSGSRRWSPAGSREKLFALSVAALLPLRWRDELFLHSDLAFSCISHF